ncbi:hypothetical protein LTR86_003315 [Recurvomyces mirabilis]|nr:hypothetical protein LTR86_003315 [Recurvomyces mirabilis]
MGKRRRAASGVIAEEVVKSVSREAPDLLTTIAPTRTAEHEVIELSSEEDVQPSRKKQKPRKNPSNQTLVASTAAQDTVENKGSGHAPFVKGASVLAHWRGDLHLAFVDEINIHEKNKVWLTFLNPDEGNRPRDTMMMKDLKRPYGNLPLKTADFADADRRYSVGGNKVTIVRGAAVFARHPHGNRAFYPATVVSVKDKNRKKYEVRFLRDGSKLLEDRNHVFPMFLGDPYKLDPDRKDIWPTVGKFTVVSNKNWADREQYVKGHLWLEIPLLSQPTAIQNTSPQTIVVDDDPIPWQDIMDMTFLPSDDNKLIINCRALSKGGLARMLIADQWTASGLFSYRGHLTNMVNSFAIRDIDRIFYLYTSGTAMWLKVVLKRGTEHVFAMIASKAAKHNLLCIINILLIKLRVASYREGKASGSVPTNTKGMYAKYVSGRHPHASQKSNGEATIGTGDFGNDSALGEETEEKPQADDRDIMPAPNAERTTGSTKTASQDEDGDGDYTPSQK